jgi:ribosomal protein S18 acetylase RimI-like enzyme
MALIRPATDKDGAAIARVHVAAWQGAYRGAVPDSYLDSMDAAERGRAWERLLVAGGGKGRVVFGESPAVVLVAEDDNREIVGICSFGPARPAEGQVVGEENPPGSGELMMINFDPSAWGTGLARRMLEAATTGLERGGHKEAVLWVLDSNARARRFYEKHGWRPDGAEKLDERPGFALRELRYRRQLGTSC